MSKVSLFICDDHALFRKGMSSLLNEGEVAEVLQEAGSGEELMEKLKFSRPDVILLDLNMPGMGGESTLKSIRTQYPKQKVIIITMNDDDSLILHLMEVGANAYLLKESEPDEVENAISAVQENGFYFNDRVSRLMLSKLVKGDKFQPSLKKNEELTEREMEVLECVCSELTNTEIGEKLFISPRTVEGHRKKIMEKLGVRNTVGMVIYAIKKGWVDPATIELG